MMEISIDQEIVARLILNDDGEDIAYLFNSMGDLVKKDCYNDFVNYLDDDGKQFFKTIAKLIEEPEKGEL